MKLKLYDLIKEANEITKDNNSEWENKFKKRDARIKSVKFWGDVIDIRADNNMKKDDIIKIVQQLNLAKQMKFNRQIDKPGNTLDFVFSNQNYDHKAAQQRFSDFLKQKKIRK